MVFNSRLTVAADYLEKASTPRERVLLFAENGLWYDALTLLAEERRKKPKDAQIAKDWKDLLLSSEGDLTEIKEIVSEPIVSCWLHLRFFLNSFLGTSA